jgi:hypothetical protein
MGHFEVNFLDDHNDETLLAELRRVASLHPGSSLSVKKFKELSQRVSVDTLRRRFGTWRGALKAANLEHLYSGPALSDKMRTQHGKRRSKDDLLAELRRVVTIVGRNVLTMADFDAHSSVSAGTISRRFGGWERALTKAGIEQSESANKRWTKEQCFENLASVWTHYGKPPSFRQMFSPPSEISGDAYVNRWGTWRKALREFVSWADLDGETGKQTGPPIAEPPPRTTRVTVVRRSEPDQRHVGPRLRFRVFQRDRFRCFACGRSPATHLNIVLHADHVQPVALGGKTIFENLQTLCDGCNLGKGKLPG